MNKGSDSLKRAPHSLVKKPFTSLEGSTSSFFIGLSQDNEVYHITRLDEKSSSAYLSIARVPL
jgi:hypothetical protein